MAQFIILGGGGHAVVVADLLRRLGHEILGFLDSDLDAAVGALRHLGPNDDVVFEHDPRAVNLALGIGVVPGGRDRWRLFEKFTIRGYGFPPLFHPSAVVAEQVVVNDAAQIMAGTVVQPRSKVGTGAIVNTKSSLDHDCEVGAFVHLAPGSTVCGRVRLGDHAFIGAGATIFPNVTVGRNAIVGGGSVVTKDVPANSTVYGVPARPMSRPEL